MHHTATFARLRVLVAVSALIALSHCAPAPTSDGLARANGSAPVDAPMVDPAPPAAPFRYAYVHADVLNCRFGPTTSDAVVTKLSRGSGVTVQDTALNWAKVKTRTGSECWVADAYLVDDRNAAMAAASPIPRGKAATGKSVGRASMSYHSSGSSTGRFARSGRSSSGTRGRAQARSYSGNCPCSGQQICIGPRGGRYCITSGGNKRYGV